MQEQENCKTRNLREMQRYCTHEIRTNETENKKELQEIKI